MTAHQRRRIVIDLPAAWVERLHALGEPEAVLTRLADHAQQGVCRPGAWERGWLEQAFGYRWDRMVEPWPETPVRQRRKADGPDRAARLPDGDVTAPGDAAAAREEYR